MDLHPLLNTKQSLILMCIGLILFLVGTIGLALL